MVVSWSPNSEPDLAGYTVYWGAKSGEYLFHRWIEKPNTVCSIQGFTSSGVWFFALTASDSTGNESALSEEVAFLVECEEPPVMADSVRFYANDPRVDTESFIKESRPNDNRFETGVCWTLLPSSSGSFTIPILPYIRVRVSVLDDSDGLERLQIANHPAIFADANDDLLHIAMFNFNEPQEGPAVLSGKTPAGTHLRINYIEIVYLKGE